MTNASSEGSVRGRVTLLIGADEKWLSTEGFLDKVSENLSKAMA